MTVIKRKPVPTSSSMEKDRRAEMQRQERELDGNKEHSEISFDLELFQASSSKTTSRGNLIVGIISVINASSGKRVTLSKDLMVKLNNPDRVVISFTEDYIAIAERLPNNENYLTVKTSGTKGNIYSAGLVSEITNMYGLDFSNKTSITFSKVKYIQNDGCAIAIIDIK